MKKLMDSKLRRPRYIEAAEDSEDEKLVCEVRAHPQRPETMREYAAALRKFSNWLDKNKKPRIADRLSDPGLMKDAEEWRRVDISYRNKIRGALETARKIRADVAPYPADADLIKEAAEAVKADIAGGGGKFSVTTRQGLQREARLLNAFGAWLRSRGRAPIDGRLLKDPLNKEDPLSQDVRAFHTAKKAEKGVKGSLSGGIKMLREYEKEKEKELADFTAELERQLESNDGSDVDEAMSPITPDAAVGLTMLGGLPPSELNHGRHFVPTLMEELPDYSAYVSLDFNGGPAPERVIRQLGDENRLPTLFFKSQDVLIRGRRWTAELRPGTGPATPYNSHGLQIDLVPWTGRSGQQIPAPVRTTASNPPGDNVTPAEGHAAEMQSDRRIRHRPYRTSRQASGSRSRSARPLELAPEQWLNDEHIRLDYEHLRAQLQSANPDLAARTRFATGSEAFYARHGEQNDIQGVIRDEDGNEMDFLFLPVNNALPGGYEGSHWSLLFVDRRERENPVAYHYDSLRQFNSNVAQWLAKRLGAPRLRPARMAQQQNAYDCGVFVVEATRELVRRLAQGERPERGALHLEHLSVDRPALEERLSQHQRRAE